jgi:hypothetical protein
MQAKRSVDCPYRGLIPYAEEDAPFFFGRDADRQIIMANLYAARLTILYGASGVGKSSVLQAGVAYHLHQQPGRAVVVFNNWKTDPVAELKQAVANEIEQILGQQVPAQVDLPLDEFLQQCERDLSGPLVIILDQFEEYFLYHPQDDDSRSFEAEFARAVNDAECQASFLISMREDALSKLDRFERRIPGLFDNYLRLEHLNRESTREAITRPLEVYNRQLPPEQRAAVEDDMVEEVIRQVKIGQVLIGQVGRGQVARAADQSDEGELRVEAPYLQLVLTRLWDEEIKRGSHILRLATLASLGGAERIVHTHLDTAMGNLKPDQQEISARIFHFLVTPSGMKIAHTAGDLAGYAELPAARVETVVSRLAKPDLRILRPVSSGVSEDGPTRYEIFHDVLAPAVLDWRARYFARSSISTRLILIAASMLIAVTAVPFILPLPRLILAFVRSISLIVLNTVTLLQVYRWFSRYVRLTIASLSLIAYGGPNIGIVLGVLLTILWYASTLWPSCVDLSNPLGSLTSSQYLQYLIATPLLLTLPSGLIIFLTMRIAGRLTYWFFKSFDRGFYGFYFGVCALIAGLSILYSLGILDGLKWLKFGPTFCS